MKQVIVVFVAFVVVELVAALVIWYDLRQSKHDTKSKRIKHTAAPRTVKAAKAQSPSPPLAIGAMKTDSAPSRG